MPKKTYSSEAIDVSYEVRRCIHAEECVHRMGAVFNIQAKPWIQPQQASSPDDLAQTIEACPTGALHYTRKDGGPEEAIPQENTVRLASDGPLYLRGKLRLQTPNGEIQDTRAALCRCGAAQNKPFCDNAHQKIEFSHDGSLGENWLKTIQAAEDELLIEPQENGSLKITGQMTIASADGETLYEGNQTWLCRCGHSENKPFCDGTHNRIGFQAD